MTTQLEKHVHRLATAIIAYVERADGPVTLCEVHREIPAFAKEGAPAWDCRRELNGKLAIYWTGMTEAGAAALNEVMFGRKLAVQPTNILPYLLEGGVVEDEDWQPVLLLPAKAANLATPHALFRLPAEFLETTKMKPGWRLLTPSPMSTIVDWHAV